MPTVTILTRSDPLKVSHLAKVPFSCANFVLQNEAFTFLAGSIGSFSLTIWFVPILQVIFPPNISMALSIFGI